MLRIGDFSRLSRISIRMLRHYDEIGLLRPVETDPFTGYRYYREDQLLLAGRINALKDMGFSLAAIGELLRCGDDPEALRRSLCVRREELLQEAKQAEYRLRLLDTAFSWLRKDRTLMNYNVTVKTIPQRTVASVRMILPSYDCVGTAWKVLMEETAPLSLVEDDPCLCCAVFHDSEFKEADVDIEIQKTVKGHYEDTEHVKFRREPAVTVASAIHNGSYLTLDDAMRAVAQWVGDNGYEFAGPAFNIYHVSPYETDDPDKFVTEICYPVVPK